MLGLPASTEIRKTIPKTTVFSHFGADMRPEKRKRFDTDIARITLTNEISPASVNLAAGAEVQSFFIVLIALRQRDFDPQSIALIPRMFGQNLLMVLEADGRQRLALWHTKLYMGDWAASESLRVELAGVNLDQAWAHIVADIAGVTPDERYTLDELLARAERCEKLKKEIARLENKAWAEKQPKKKFDLTQQKRARQKELEELERG